MLVTLSVAKSLLIAVNEMLRRGVYTEPVEVLLRMTLETMENIGRLLMIGGVILFVIGGLVFLASKFGIPFGRLPGDIVVDRDNFRVYFPLTTTIIVSLLLSALLWFLRK